MYENSERVDQFKAEVADMKLRDPATGLDRLLSRLGLLGMAAGIAMGVVAYFVSHDTLNPRQQRDAIVLALLAATIALVGAAFWLKATLAGFLRFWIARLVYEQQAQGDRVMSAVSGTTAASPNSAPRATTSDTTS